MRSVLKFSFILLMFISCKKENAGDCFKSNGSTITQQREITAFKHLLVQDNIEVLIKNGTEFKVEVTAGKNIIKNIITKIEDDILILQNNNRCNFVRGYKRKIQVTVTVTELTKVTNAGVAAVKFAEDYKDDSLTVRNESSGDTYINGDFLELITTTNGNGDMHVSGNANVFYVYTDGTNFVRAENIKVKNFAFLHSTAIGDCFFNAEGVKDFAYNIQGSGNIYYTGTPGKLEDYGDGSGSGSLIQK